MPNHLAYKLPMSALDVVVIDDNHPMRKILQTILNAFGVRQVRTFSDGESALLDMAIAPPNLVITDWRMKPGNGYQVVRTMRHESSMPLSLVPVIMLTGYASRDFVQKSFEVGVQQFLTKPISPDALLKRIKWILQDERELVLQNQVYVSSKKTNIQNEHQIRSRAKAQVLYAQKLARQSITPDIAPEIANDEDLLDAPVKVAQAGGGRQDTWEI